MKKTCIGSGDWILPSATFRSPARSLLIGTIEQFPKFLKKKILDNLTKVRLLYYCVNLISNSALKILNVGLNSYHWIKRVSIIIMIKDQGLVIQSCNLYSSYKLFKKRKLLSKQPASPGQTNCFWGWQHGASDLHHLQYACSGKSSLIHIHNSLG